MAHGSGVRTTGVSTRMGHGELSRIIPRGVSSAVFFSMEEILSPAVEGAFHSGTGVPWERNSRDGKRNLLG